MNAMNAMNEENDPGVTARLARAAVENRGEFSPLYEHLERRLYAWACLMVRGEMSEWLDAEDLVAEVWLRCLGNFQAFDSEKGSFRDWLFGVAYNTHRTLSRRERRRATDDVPEDLRQDATSVSKRVARNEGIREAVRKLLLGFTDEELKLVLLHGIEGLSFSDLERLTGVAKDTQKRRWQRLKPRLQRIAGLRGLLDIQPEDGEA